MFKKSLALIAGGALFASTSVFAQTVCEQCGSSGPPPPPSQENFGQFICRVKGNAGIGNGGDQRATEVKDCDPGKSGLHNQAWKNIDKPPSPHVVR